MQIEPRRVSRKRHAAIAVVLLVVLIVAGVVAGTAVGRGATELGKTRKTPEPLCPQECRATGTVTGFGVAADGSRGIFKVPEAGHLVAWSVELSKPTDDQLNGFGELFKDDKWGTDPVARLAVLKPLRKDRYKLTKQSAVVQLLPSLGERPIFTLKKPIKVTKGLLVALTLPTWAPLFRDGLPSKDDIWVASRDPDKCGGDEVVNAKPHQRIGQTRTYGCRLKGERLLYWAYFVPDA